MRTPKKSVVGPKSIKLGGENMTIIPKWQREDMRQFLGENYPVFREPEHGVKCEEESIEQHLNPEENLEVDE